MAATFGSAEARSGDVYHVWSKCFSCGVWPIEGRRYHCETCLIGSDNDLCERCYLIYTRGGIAHGEASSGLNQTLHHVFLEKLGVPVHQLQQALEVPDCRASQMPYIPGELLVRPEFVSCGESSFGATAFGVETDHGPLVLSALHVLNELARMRGIDATSQNCSYSGRELPQCIDGVNLYDLMEDKWILHPIGLAGPMLVLPDARMNDDEPYSHRDIGAFRLPGSSRLGRIELATVPPSIGDLVWLVARLIGTRRARPAVVVESTDRCFVFRFLDSEPGPRNTSGAPIVNGNGHAVGINSGEGRFAGRLFGHACSLSSIRRHLDRSWSP